MSKKLSFSENAIPVTRAEHEGKKPIRLVRAAARIAVVARWPDGRKCLFVRHPNKGLELPGGAIEPDEEPSQAGLRELSEETGIQLPIDYPLTLITMVPVKDRRGGNWLDIIYGTQVKLPQIAIEREAELPMNWLTAEEIEGQVDQQLSSYKAALTALNELYGLEQLRKSRNPSIVIRRM